MDGSGWEYLERFSKDYDKDIKKLKEQIERLQERLKDAEHILDEMGWADRGLIDDYFEKWGVK